MNNQVGESLVIVEFTTILHGLYVYECLPLLQDACVFSMYLLKNEPLRATGCSDEVPTTNQQVAQEARP